MIKKRLTSLTGIACLLLSLVFVTVLLAGEFVGSKKSNKYHYPSCRWAQKIKPENLVKFTSPEEATKAGYIPCKVCKPPMATRSEISTDIGRIICCDGRTLSPTYYYR